MKYLPFRILILCLLFPPILYIFSIHTIEQYLHKKYLREIENSYLGNVELLLEGRENIKEAVPTNIKQFKASKSILSWGVETKIYITTRDGTLLYPPSFDKEDPFQISDPLETASLNYQIMNEGINVELDLTIEHIQGLSNAILGFYLLMAVGIFYYFYKTGANKAFEEEQEIKQKIAGLETVEEDYEKKLVHLNKEKESLASEYEMLINELEKDRQKAGRHEEDMIDEVVELEKKIAENIASQEEQQNEILTLKEELARYEKGRTKIKASETVKKRFSVLYKNLVFRDKAIEGFSALTENMKIKAEEMIHQLDRDPSLVTVKRKVFGKKGRETVLEVVFAYKGRLYYRRLKDGRIDVVTIGTKNVQSKDLEFLDRL